MSRSKGKRYEGEARLNIKKVVFVIALMIAIIAFSRTLYVLLKSDPEGKLLNIKTKNYFSVLIDNKWGVIDSNGSIVIQPEYDEMIQIPNKERAVFICISDITTDGYTTKVINNKNEEILKEYDLIEAIDNYNSKQELWYENDVLRVKKDGLYGLINFEGKELVKPAYENIYSLKGIKNALVVTKDGEMGLINNSGKIIINTDYKKILPLAKANSGYIVTGLNEKVGLVDKDGIAILDNIYEDIKDVSGDNKYIVKENGEFKVINKEKEVFLEGKFDEIKAINGDNILFKKDNKYGVIGLNGEIKIAAKYQYIEFAFNTNYIVEENNKFGIINIENTVILEITYSNINYNKAGEFIIADKTATEAVILDKQLNIKASGIISEINDTDGFIKYNSDNEYKYLNYKLEEKTNIEILTQNTLFLSKKEGKYGFVDKNKNVVVEYKYDDATEQNKFGFVAVKLNGVWGSLNKDGNVSIEPTYNLDNNIFLDFIGIYHIGKDANNNYYTNK